MYVNRRNRVIISVISRGVTAYITACAMGCGGGPVGTLLCDCQSKGKHLLFFKGRKELCAHFCHVFMSVTYIIPNLGHLQMLIQSSERVKNKQTVCKPPVLFAQRTAWCGEDNHLIIISYYERSSKGATHLCQCKYSIY